jgi:hypothetical protein
MSVAVQDSKPRANPLSPRPLRAADFCRMSQQQLDDLFRASPTGAIPRGVTQGTAIVRPGTWFAPVGRLLARWFCWKGKVFNPDGTALVNRISPFGVKAIKAAVSYDTSWLDGSRAILIDYSKTSFVAQKIRDEIREVTPGVYLGKVWWGKKRVLDFALEV